MTLRIALGSTRTTIAIAIAVRADERETGILIYGLPASRQSYGVSRNDVPGKTYGEQGQACNFSLMASSSQANCGERSISRPGLFSQDGALNDFNPRLKREKYAVQFPAECLMRHAFRPGCVSRSTT
jgi:hypothetical protein